MTWIAVLLGGFVGAVARQEIFSRVQQWSQTPFPVGIMVVNLTGAFGLGLLHGTDILDEAPRWLFLTLEVGAIGAFTTYSTWALDSLRLHENQRKILAWTNLIASLIAAVALVWIGTAIGQALS